MKIVSLEAENYKRLKAVSIKPDGSVITITGKNGAGKSSLLDSIFAAVGGADALPSKPIRKGEQRRGGICSSRRRRDDLPSSELTFELTGKLPEIRRNAIFWHVGTLRHRHDIRRVVPPAKHANLKATRDCGRYFNDALLQLLLSVVHQLADYVGSGGHKALHVSTHKQAKRAAVRKGRIFSEQSGE